MPNIADFKYSVCKISFKLVMRENMVRNLMQMEYENNCRNL